MGDHDKLFKRAFSAPNHAAGEIRSVLPEAVTDRMDLEKLRLVPASFVDAEMTERHADLLFCAPIDGEDAYVYFLFEHQSASDPLMTSRILGYMVRIWDRIVREDPDRRTVPIVVPIIVHNGTQPWTGPVRFHELVDWLEAFPDLVPLVPDFELRIDDLAALDDEALRKRPLGAFAKLSLWALRDARSVERLLGAVRGWSHLFQELVRTDPRREDIQVLLGYIRRASGDLSYELVRDTFIEAIPEVEANMASAAEELIQRGREEGLQKGLQKGLRKGRGEANRTTLSRLLGLRFGALDADTEARIGDGNTGELERWLERMMTAETLDGVFAD